MADMNKTDTRYKVSHKVTGKWYTFGIVSKNKFGNWSLGLKKSPDLMKILQEAKEGEWVNFAMFSSEENPAKSKASEPPTDNF